jgi:hypothetical protein
MVAARIRASDCAGREPTATVGLQPLKAECAFEVLAVLGCDLHIKLSAFSFGNNNSASSLADR